MIITRNFSVVNHACYLGFLMQILSCMWFSIARSGIYKSFSSSFSPCSEKYIHSKLTRRQVDFHSCAAMNLIGWWWKWLRCGWIKVQSMVLELHNCCSIWSMKYLEVVFITVSSISSRKKGLGKFYLYFLEPFQNYMADFFRQGVPHLPWRKFLPK